jgi:hypothetical protein
MKKRMPKGQSDDIEIRSIEDFKKKFYPDSSNGVDRLQPNPEDFGGNLAKRSLETLQTVLASKAC